MVAAIVPDYSLSMSATPAASVFRVIERKGPFSRLVLRQDANDGARLIVISGFCGAAVPERVTRPELAPGDGAAMPAMRWRLICAEGVFDFQARAIDYLDVRPALYGPMHARFELSAVDRFAVRVLLRMLRFPGGARVLRWWQSLR